MKCELKKSLTGRRRWLFSVLFAAALWMLLILGAGAVQASPNRISFNDGSGKTLEYNKNRWILKDNRGNSLTGLQYISIRETRDLSTGYYVFDGSGCMIQKRAVYKFSNKKVRNMVFDGFYYTASKSGRLCYTASGLVYMKNVKCAGQTFDGYYYVDKMGKLSTPASKVRYLEKTTVNGTVFQAGHYFFTALGRLCRAAQFHSVYNQKVKGISFDGQYYFCSGGRLCTKEGLVTVDGKKYYVTKEGKKVVNAWKAGYYFLKDGTMAVSMQVPDGSWVDGEGRKITKEEKKLLPLRDKLKSMIAGFPGTWSVYVKDLKTGDILIINSQQMYPASTIKTFGMAFAFDLISRGKLAYDGNMQMLLNYMITESDNDCFNQIISMAGSGNFLAGAKLMNEYLKKNGYTGTIVHHTAKPAHDGFITDGGTNTSTVKDCALLLERIYKGNCVNAECSGQMMNLLRNQKRRWKIPASLPSGAVVANKTGENEEVQHDIALVAGPKTDYVICVFSKASESDGISGIKSISRTVWDGLE